MLVAGSATFKGGPDRYAANIAALKSLGVTPSRGGEEDIEEIEA